MKINIYGTGRSGTKAVLLYLAYYLAKENSNICRLNYEPYYWASRGVRSFEGMWLDQKERYFPTSQSPINKRHANFLSQLIDEDHPTITKFIRAAGRIEQIEQVMKPDISVFVVRPLPGVLRSLSKMSWDYFGEKESPVNCKNWDRFVGEMSNDERFSASFMEFMKEMDINNWMHRSSVYWYYCNIYALKGMSQQNMLFVDYRNLSRLEIDVKNIFSNNITPLKISNPLFEGKNIDSETPFRYSRGLKKDKLFSKLLIECYKFFPNTTSIISGKLLDIGDIVELNTMDKEIYYGNENKQSSLTFKKRDDLNDSFLEGLNTSILELLKERK